MTALVIESTKKTETSSATVRLMIDKKEYLLISGGSTVNVVCGNAFSLRTLGKCFWDVENIETHYKKHGKVLVQFAKELMASCS